MSDEIFIKDPSVPVNCEKCGREIEYQGLGTYVCKSCGFTMYDDYGKVRNYLDAHRGATQAEVSRMTGVSQHKIRTMIQEDRFEITQNSAVFLTCEICGAAIRSGRYCENCLKKIAMQDAKADKRTTTKNMSGYGGFVRGASGEKRFTRS